MDSPLLISILLGGSAVAMCVLLARKGAYLRQSQMRLRQLEAEHAQALRGAIEHHAKLEASLASMVEGVLAVDASENLVSINEAAARLLHIRADLAPGSGIDAVIPSIPLRNLLREALQSEQPLQADIEILPGADGGEHDARMFLAQAAPLRDTQFRRIGAVVVIHDVTRLRRLEVVRRDFVSNASHEIKTPVTAIKAAAETLLDSAPPAEPGTTAEDDPHRYFLNVILRQANRLQAIIEDLLSLARIEQDTEHERVTLELAPLVDVMRAAVETCQAMANERQTRIEVVCPTTLRARINAPLLEQALINLLENAIKYSPTHATVRATTESVNSEVVLTVQDRGVGISSEHLPRIFERFYRTDRARSRELGGTGLGLSIVKHIALSHGGRVSVDSTLGVGSIFRIHLPGPGTEATLSSDLGGTSVSVEATRDV